MIVVGRVDRLREKGIVEVFSMSAGNARSSTPIVSPPLLAIARRECEHGGETHEREADSRQRGS